MERDIMKQKIKDEIEKQYRGEKQESQEKEDKDNK